ncbi:MAG: hypothetical protein Q4C47_03400 [Planctomycetia bacterium]|nr:hypothetical protein [Planctomycetia bacterium]
MKYSRITIHTFLFSTLFSLFHCAVGIASAQTPPHTEQNRPLCTGVIAVPEANLFSGPGLRYYATETLPQGTRLEIWRIRDDGWCAVRPTPESFSLVAPESLERDVPEPGLATVKQNGTPSCIGSTCSGAKHTIQVRLQRGEVVRLKDPEDDTRGLWCRIYPPAGEYRWIRTDQMYALPLSTEISRSSPVYREYSTIPPEHTPENLTPGNHASENGASESSVSVHGASRIGGDHGASGIRPVTAVVPMAGTIPGTAMSVATDPGSRPATLPPPGTTSGEARYAPTTIPEVPARGEILAGTDQTYGYPMSQEAGMTPFQNGLIRISERMNTMTQGDPSQWDLTTLQGEVASLSGMAISAEERQQAEIFEQQLTEYQRVQREIATAGGSGTSGNGNGLPLNNPTGFPGMTSVPETAAEMGMYGNRYSGTDTIGGMSPTGGVYGNRGITTAPDVEDTSFRGRMKRFFERLQFWKVSSPRRNYSGNWAIPVNRPFGNGEVSTMRYSGGTTNVGMANGGMVSGGYGTAGMATRELPTAEKTSEPVSGWRPRGQMATRPTTGNGVVFGDQSKTTYQRTIPTTAETVPPPVPEGVGR